MLRWLLHRLRIRGKRVRLIHLLRAWRTGDTAEQQATYAALRSAMPEHFVPSPESKVTPLGIVRRDLDGWELARRREYAVKPAERKDGLQ